MILMNRLLVVSQSQEFVEALAVMLPELLVVVVRIRDIAVLD
jgi:hypothetical protein